MGTNYYVDETRPCPNCDREHICQTHIGKASGGWKFLFSSDGDFELTSFDNFRKFLEDKEIRDEYDEPVTHKEFWEIVRIKQKESNDHLADSQYCIVLDGYAFMKGYFS